MNLGLFKHIVLIGVVVAIGFLYIKPTLAGLSETQDSVAEYEEALEQAKKLNAELDNLISQTESIRSESREALNKYMPSQTDEVAVLKDLEIIAELSGLVLVNVGVSDGGQRRGRNSEEALYLSQTYQMGLVGSYENFKDFLKLLEQNDYPLYIKTLSISGEVGGSESNYGVGVSRSAARASIQSSYSYELDLESYELSLPSGQ